MTTGVDTPSRQLIFAAMLVAAAANAALLLLRPAAGGWPETVSQLVPVALAVAALAVVLTAAVRALRGQAEPRRHLLRERDTFVVPVNRTFGYFVAAQVLLLGFITGQTINYGRRTTAAGAPFDSMMTTALALVALVMALLLVPMLVGALRGRPGLALTRDALIVYDLLGSRSFEWNALRTDEPVRRHDRHKLDLAVDRSTIGRTGLVLPSIRITMSYLSVDAGWLAGVIRYYVGHRDRRTAIGTEAELARLFGDAGTTVS